MEEVLLYILSLDFGRPGQARRLAKEATRAASARGLLTKLRSDKRIDEMASISVSVLNEAPLQR